MRESAWTGLRPGLLLLALLLLFLLRRGFIRRLAGEGFPFTRSPQLKAAEGLAAAAFILVTTLLPALLAGGFAPTAEGWRPFPDPAGGTTGWHLPGLLLVQSLSEELDFRGVLMLTVALPVLAVWWTAAGRRSGAAETARRRQLGWFGTGLFANLLQALAFAALHGGNPHVTPLALLNIGLAGLVLGRLAWSQASLWGCWSFHFAWNLASAALGLPVSGLRLSGGLIAGARPGLLTGGAFGPEGSLANTAALAVLIAFFAARDASTLGRNGYPSSHEG